MEKTPRGGYLFINRKTTPPLNKNNTETYHPRAVENHGVWKVDDLEFKIYGLLAQGQELSNDVFTDSHVFLSDDVLSLVAEEGGDNGLGFLIVHQGELGLTIAAHWWIQGSVLCQHIIRKVHGAEESLDSVKRPVIGCIWELALINAEQEIWRETMMTGAPNPEGYLVRRADFDAA